MGVDHLGGSDGLRQEIQKLWRELRRVAKATLQNASIGRAGIRFYDAGSATFEGGGGVRILGGGFIDGSGTFDWTGPMNLQGAQTITGPTTFTGQMTVNGPWDLNGNGDITGDVAISGDLTLNSDLTLGTGRIVAGPVRIDKLGPAAGRIVSTGQMVVDGASIYLGASTSVQGPLSCTGDFFASGDVGGGSKSFWIDHPTKPGRQLRHGSLEGPEHAVFYRGVVEFDDQGEAVFVLPDYFTALVMPDVESTVQVTAIGRPFAVGAELVEDGRTVVYGASGRKAHVTVIAARELFDVEPVKVERVPLSDPVGEDQ